MKYTLNDLRTVLILHVPLDADFEIEMDSESLEIAEVWFDRLASKLRISVERKTE